MPQNFDCTLLHSRSLLPRSKRISTQPQFSIWLMRETVNEDNETQIGDTKNLSVIKKGVVNERLIPFCTIVHFLSIFFDFSSTALEISLFLSSLVRRLNLVAVDSSLNIAEFLHKMAMSLKNCRIKQQNHSFLANCTNSALSSHYFV